MKFEKGEKVRLRGQKDEWTIEANRGKLQLSNKFNHELIVKQNEVEHVYPKFPKVKTIYIGISYDEFESFNEPGNYMVGTTPGFETRENLEKYLDKNDLTGSHTVIQLDVDVYEVFKKGSV